MPRIELIPANGVGEHEGTPTIDVCWSCTKLFTEGVVIDDDLLEELADDVLDDWRDDYLDGGVVGSTDVAHPPYENGNFCCACCGDWLTAEDDEA